MRPNGRTIRKVLMKSRRLHLWGPRSYIQVRLPMSVFPVPPPSQEYSRKWGLESFNGFWKRELDNGTIEYRHISKVSSSAPPTADDGRFHFLEEVNEPGGSRYVWWEGKFAVYSKGEKLTRTDLPIEDIAAHRAWSIWKEAHLYGFFPESRGPVMRGFLETADFATTHFGTISDQTDLSRRYAYLTYTVKWYERETFQQFIASLKRTFRVADKHGVDARLMR